MKFNADTFIAWLASHKGRRLTFEKIELYSASKKNHHKKRKKKNYSHVYKNEQNTVLSELEQMGLLTINHDHVKIKKHFRTQGILSVARSGIGFVDVDMDSDVFISPQNKNHAGHRDLVEIEITGKRRERYEGKVTEIIKSFHKQMVALVKTIRPDGYVLQFVDLPDNPLGFLPKDQVPKALQKNDLLLAEKNKKTISLVTEPEPQKEKQNSYSNFRHRNLIKQVPLCSFVDLVANNNERYFRRILQKYNLESEYPTNFIPTRKHLKMLQKEALKDPQRKNLVKLFSCTIDGEDSKDFDDAISIEEFPNHFILYVHIADVSYYVKDYSVLDKEAFNRATSYYLENYVLPMLPPILSEEFCSLNPKTRRPAFTCQMKILHSGEITEFDFYKSIIYLNKRYTYNTAQKEIDGNKKTVMHTFWKLAQTLIKKRNQNGRMNLHIPETQIIFDKQGNMQNLVTAKRLDSHKLIEEFMLSANICASIFTRQNKIPSLYRVHETIPPDNLERVNNFLKLYHHKGQLKNGDQKQLSKIIEKNKDHPQQKIFHYTLLRAFSQAYYHSEPLGHWGLAFDDYAHFTSPIRRYPDLVVHRQIAAFINKEDYSYNKKDIAGIGKHCSRMERLAMEAERDMFKLLSVSFMKKYEEQVFHAQLSGFSSLGLYISLDNPPVEGIVPLASFSDDFEIKNLDDFRIYLPKFQKTIAIGTKLTARLIRADEILMRNEFELLAIE